MNDLMKYKSVDEFALAVYQRITTGIENLAAQEQVDTLLKLDEMFKQATTHVRGHLYGHAERQQADVLETHAVAYIDTAQHVVKATQSGDLGAVDDALERSIEATLKCKSAATKLKQIKERKTLLHGNGTH